MDEDKIWQMVATGAAVAGAAALKPVVEKGWAQVTGSPPPGNPAGTDVTWRQAILWAVVSGALIGLVRLIAQRAAAEAWRKRRGDYPPALRTTRA